jgi:predicted hotdog family 3-hydroxylacyl-ACP dehydratase
MALSSTESPETPGLLFDRDWIAARIPHHGAMCLLDGVTAWDATRIECLATSHLLADHPLRFQARLAVVCGIEYAAQAMAVHGALTASSTSTGISASVSRPRAGYLTSVRNVQAHVDRLDSLNAPLKIEAVLFHGDVNHMMYAFALSCESKPVLSGRASVILDADRHAVSSDNG